MLPKKWSSLSRESLGLRSGRRHLATALRARRGTPLQSARPFWPPQGPFPRSPSVRRPRFPPCAVAGRRLLNLCRTNPFLQTINLDGCYINNTLLQKLHRQLTANRSNTLSEPQNLLDMTLSHSELSPEEMLGTSAWNMHLDMQKAWSSMEDDGALVDSEVGRACVQWRLRLRHGLPLPLEAKVAARK